MRRAWLLIAGAEAPYFLANRGRFKNPLPPSRAREDEHLNKSSYENQKYIIFHLG